MDNIRQFGALRFYTAQDAERRHQDSKEKKWQVRFLKEFNGVISQVAHLHDLEYQVFGVGGWGPRRVPVVQATIPQRQFVGVVPFMISEIDSIPFRRIAWSRLKDDIGLSWLHSMKLLLPHTQACLQNVDYRLDIDEPRISRCRGRCR